MWRQITYKGWYAKKQTNQPTNWTTNQQTRGFIATVLVCELKVKEFELQMYDNSFQSNIIRNIIGNTIGKKVLNRLIRPAMS